MGFEPAAWLQRLKRYVRGRFAVNAWRRFGKDVRSDNCELLKCLKDYPDSVLVAGCQRSGTTMLARLITASDGMVDYYFGVDDEHDAALLLSGLVDKPEEGRYCFQTTYLNECYPEYFHNDVPFRLIWVVRNPYSVVCSLLYNWERYPLNELFEACGLERFSNKTSLRYRLFRTLAVSRLERACYGYAGKTAQALELAERLPAEQFMVVDYDQLVRSKETWLPKLYQFIGLDYMPEYADRVHAQSLDKSSRLTQHERDVIEQLCMPVYKQVAELSMMASSD